jgi:hypothetical protein
LSKYFWKQADRIKSAESQIYEATEVMYEAINDRIEELVSKTNYPCKYVVLIGAIFQLMAIKKWVPFAPTNALTL